MRQAILWLVVGLGGVVVGGVLTLAVSIEVWVALVVLGVVTVMFAHIERSIEVRRTATEPVLLDDKERRLGEMISKRCDWVWEGIRDRRYVKHEGGQFVGVNGGAIFEEARDIVGEVATLYHVDSDNAMLEARIGDVLFAVRQAIGALLQLAHQVPYLDPTGWSIREVVTRLEQVQKGISLYRQLSPYQHYARGALLLARLASGANPVSLAVWYAAWYVGGQAAKWVAGKVLTPFAEKRLKGLLESVVALVYLQVARTYDPRLAYRSADWVAFVEMLRIHAQIPGSDHNRKLLLDHILRAQIADELSKLTLLRALADDREPDSRTAPPIDFASLLPEQRQAIADRLRDMLSDMKGLNVPAVVEAIEDLERRLQCRLEVDLMRYGSPDSACTKKGFMRSRMRSIKAHLRHWWRWHRGGENSR